MSKIKGRDVLKVKVCFRTLVFEKERLHVCTIEQLQYSLFMFMR